MIFTKRDYTLVFEWDPPSGSDTELIYTVVISPRSISHPIINAILTSPFFVILEYNMVYNTSITSVNCAGKSISVMMNNIEYGV